MAYSIFDPKVNRPLHELPRQEAQAAYNWFIENIPVRLEELKGLLLNDGIDLDFSDRSLIELHEWFFSIVQEEWYSGNERPSSELFSICLDIGVYIAEMVKTQSPRITWSFYTTETRGLYFQRPVITGFDVKNKDYHVDFDHLLCLYAFRILKSGKKEDDLFFAMYQEAKNCCSSKHAAKP